MVSIATGKPGTSELFMGNEAIARGALETAALPEEKLKHLEEAALLKKQRALQNIIDRTGSAEDLLYLKLSDQALERLLA